MLPLSPVSRPLGGRHLEHALPPCALEQPLRAPAGLAQPPPPPRSRLLGAAGLALAAAAGAGRSRRGRRSSRWPGSAEGRRRSAAACSAKRRRPEVDVRPEINHVDLARRSFFLSQCPPEDSHLPEIACFGRSNVGKSSLINYLAGRKLLATISKHPGHTRLIHHFLCDRSWYLVDLPGIGFAEGTGKQLKSMNKVIAAYVRHRSTLVELLYLVDASVPPTPLDLHGIQWLTDAGVYLSIVFTKTDKVPRSKELAMHGPVEVFTRALMNVEGSPFRLGVRDVPQMFLTSSAQRTGKEALLEHIADLRRRAKPRYLQLQRQLKGKESVREGEGAMHQAVALKEPPPGIR